MGERAYKAIKLFKILIVFLLISSVFSIFLSSYLFMNKGVEQRIAEDLEIGDGPPKMGAICTFGIVFLIIGGIMIGLMIGISVQMIKSRKEDSRLESDGIIGGVLVLCTFATGFISSIPFLGSLSSLAQTGLMYGGLMIFIRKLLPDKFKKLNILAFVVLMSGSFITSVGRFHTEFMQDNGADHIMTGIASIIMISGLILYLVILGKCIPIPPIPPRRENWQQADQYRPEYDHENNIVDRGSLE